MRYAEIKDRSNKDFKLLTGVEHPTFQQMVSVLENEMPNFGRPPKLSREDQLLLTLMYWREYRTQFHIGIAYRISESAVCRTIRKVEDALIHSGRFQLPGKKALQPSDIVVEIIVVDATKQPIERPKKKQRRHYSGKKKRHTQKAQGIVNLSTMEIIATAIANDSTHNFRLFKENYVGVA